MYVWFILGRFWAGDNWLHDGFCLRLLVKNSLADTAATVGVQQATGVASREGLCVGCCAICISTSCSPSLLIVSEHRVDL